MNLSESDAAYAADQFIDYFSNMGRIDEYLRNVKLDRMSKMPTYLPGCGPEEDMFDAFDMHPNDMDFKVYAAGNSDGFTNEYFNERLQITTSHSIESSIHSSGLSWKQILKRLWDLFVLVLLLSIANLVMIG
jgi:hypothetical protein